ncbi:hypothetical protein [Dactylosporangium matsuzakiense]|uniref:Uncharacterized protein n=1 Tax=Dactylosporangium matsuzakiense TaxID=53360 RepID=A0A9W6KAV5_9ACTN|nr:hypothetical protein [Dactylosporangium matsuzakiense]UWZ45300.1 hypothetical protein Dmats_01735 [Dactylosporangium matsuzakiense]GLK98725.1 hypothetical protein GCM10017581_004660 [Dactylosporangium matsuzakiense]
MTAALRDVDGRGGAPVEDSGSADGSATTPFDLVAVNREVGALFAQSGV